MTYTPEQIAEAYLANERNQSRTATAVGCSRETVQRLLRQASERGLLGTAPVMEGFRISSTTTTPNGGTFVQQKPERGEQWAVPDGHQIKGVSALVDADGRIIQQWQKTDRAATDQLAAMRAAVDAFKEELPRVEAVLPPRHTEAALLNQYTITDHHLGALAWNEETLGGDYDLRIGEKLILNWFAAAIKQAPDARRAVFAQLGDFLHYDSFKAVTPEHGHLLDAEGRYPMMVRAAIRIVRRVIRMLLEKHEQVEVIMCDANHDPASEVWLRELLAAFYEDEPRVQVDTNPGTYSVIEHGNVSLFYHHGHRKGMKDVDSIMVGKYRAIYGRTKLSYAHTGHKHSDELKTTNLMKVEQHETLAAPDSYGSNWLSGRSAKVITYHDQYGEDGRVILSAARVMGTLPPPTAANDNQPGRVAA
jgi:hypothetical protein